MVNLPLQEGAYLDNNNNSHNHKEVDYLDKHNKQNHLVQEDLDNLQQLLDLVEDFSDNLNNNSHLEDYLVNHNLKLNLHLFLEEVSNNNSLLLSLDNLQQEVVVYLDNNNNNLNNNKLPFLEVKLNNSQVKLHQCLEEVNLHKLKVEGFSEL